MLFLLTHIDKPCTGLTWSIDSADYNTEVFFSSKQFLSCYVNIYAWLRLETTPPIILRSSALQHRALPRHRFSAFIVCAAHYVLNTVHVINGLVNSFFSKKKNFKQFCFIRRDINHTYNNGLIFTTSKFYTNVCTISID